MRIGMVAPPWIPIPPPAYGGIEEVVDALARGLVGLGHEVILCAGPGSTCPVTRVQETEQGEVGKIGDMRNERRHVAQAYAAFREMDIVHDHTLSGPFHSPGRDKAPVVTTVHGPFVSKMLRLYQSMPAEVEIVAISEHQASTSGGVQISRVIHHGLDTGEIGVGTGSGGYLAFLGRMTPTKGIKQAIAIARQAGIPLLIAAKMREPAEHAYFEGVIEPLLGTDVEYLGELNKTEKYELLEEAIALLNPIQWPEPFGMVMIESMACGTPVVATPRGAAPEIIENGLTGYLSNSHVGLVAAVLKAGDLDRTAIRLRVEQRFSMERMANDYAAFYAELLADRGPDDPGPADPGGLGGSDDAPMSYQAAGL